MKTSTSVTALMMLASMFPLSAMAGLTMVIDTAAKTFWFIGSDSGSLLGSAADFTQGSWTSAGASTTENAMEVGNVSGLLVGTSGATSENLSLDFSVGTDSVNTSVPYFTLTVSSYDQFSSLTITGGGSAIKYDYSNMVSYDPSYLDNIASLIGTSIAINSTALSGFSSINVVAVPEPSEWAGAAGLGVLALAFGRKRKAAK